MEVSKNSKDYTDDYYFDRNILYTTTIFGIGSGIHLELFNTKI